MKPLRRTDSASQSCSCNSCLYKSESEQLSIRKYVAHGSRIDRLYYGKYIPLRERKLLNKLVRTRAVYDDLRARLISDSTLSLEKNADLRPGQVIKTLDGEKSGAILEIVDIIDKGSALSPKNLRECCSCCSCSSKVNILERKKKEQKRKRGYARTYEEEYGQSGRTGTGEGVYAKTYKREIGKTVPGKMGERYNKRGVRFKAKHIRSDPCTCTFKFSGLIKQHSKAMFQKLRPLPLEKPIFDIEEQSIFEKSKEKKFAKKSVQKYKDLQNKLEHDIRKLSESKAKIKQHLQLQAKKSLEQVKKVKNKIKNNIESSVRKSMQALKDLNHKDRAFESVEYPENETSFPIKKDSIVKYKDYLKKRKIMKDWECDLECEPETCVPDECFKIIKLRRLHKRNREGHRKNAAQYEIIKRKVKFGGAPLSKSNSSVQAGQFAITTETRIKKQTPILRNEGKNQVFEKRLIYESEEVKRGGKKKGVKKIIENTDEFSVMPATHGENSLTNIKKKEKDETLMEKELHLVKEEKSRTRGRQAVRIESSFSFGVEFYKAAQDNNASRSSQPSGVHVHAPGQKPKIVHRHHKKSHVVLKPSLKSSQSTPEKLKTPLTSQQGKLVSIISQCECEKKFSNIKTNTDIGTKSVSSLTNKTVLATTNKNVSKQIKQKTRLSQVSLLPDHMNTLTSRIYESNSHHKQAVRIGSTFSFNVEFYRKTNESRLKTPSVQKTLNKTHSKSRVKKTRSKNRYVLRKYVKVKETSAKAYNQTKTTLNRCFCTLKFQENRKTKKTIKKPAIATATRSFEIKESVPSMVDKYAEAKNKKQHAVSKMYQLLPYECEPGICIPGECDPILCKNIIDQRRAKRRINKSIGSYTGSRKTKSTSSIISRPVTSAKIVQSSIVPTKEGRTSIPRRYKNHINVDHKELIKTNMNASGRQAVRIGSSFSFNIEFYKDKEPPAVAVEKKTRLSQEIHHKQLQFEGGEHHENIKHNKSMFTQVLNMDKNIGPSIKRCFCTLKLYKNKVREKTYPKGEMLSTNTQTFGRVPVGETADKGTRTKRKHFYKLLPHECEPHTCIPGECDPYLCLQKIKKRELNTRDYSAFTDKAKMRSMSSLTENSYQKSEAILARPKFIERGTNQRANYIKTLDDKRKPTHNVAYEETFKSAKSKQAVRIGSSFNFSIEFSKHKHQVPMLNRYNYIKKQNTNVLPKMDKDKGITVTKVRVGHFNAQTQGPRKIDRAALVRPMLKRCFCTLNLKKKSKQYRNDFTSGNKHFGPNVYTVGRAITAKTKMISHTFESQMKLIEPENKIMSISTSSFLLNKYVKKMRSTYETIQIYSTIQLKQPVNIKSNLSMNVAIIRKLGESKKSGLCNIKQPLKTLIDDNYQEAVNPFNHPFNQNFQKLTEIGRYLTQSFCTMNVQVTNQGLPLRPKKISNKLKPYECEPGICIPGECNPYECKKLIMRRLTKHEQKSSDTNSTKKSVSSYVTSYGALHSKSTQMQAHVQSHFQESLPQLYKPQRERGRKQRQAIRVGSSFSFDLEFYKNRSQPSEKYVSQIEPNIKKPVKRKQYKTISIGPHGNKPRAKHSQLQSTFTSLHKGTGELTKKCFCTLKLQKKGRVHKDHAKVSTSIKRIPSIVSKNINVGTATKYQKISVDWNNLKSYECDPGICIPGKCDPYKCLELIKHRKDLGVNTIKKDKDSVSSMTSELYLKGKYKTRAIDAVPKKTDIKTSKKLTYIDSTENDTRHFPARQAVQISSNFSFNIEFSKDTSQQYKDTMLRRKNFMTSDLRKTKHRKELKGASSQSSKSISRRDNNRTFKTPQQYKGTKLRKRKLSKSDSRRGKYRKQLKYVSSDTSKVVSHRNTQTENPFNQGMIYKTEQKLDSVKVKNQHNTKSFKYKCLCLLGLRSKENIEIKTTENSDLLRKGNNQPTEKLVQTAEKPTNINNRHSMYSRRLKPYECEPGVCIPGQCDPYVCEKIIHKRLAKQYSKGSETESVRAQSVSSSFGNHKHSKNQRTQAKTHQKQVKYLSRLIPPSGKTTLYTDEHFANITPASSKTTLHTDKKRLVKIGSNFSLNIEFYKENVNGREANEKITNNVTQFKTYPTKNFENEKTVQKIISQSNGTETSKLLSVRENESQIRKNKTKTSGISPLIKRCFCTLKFMNKLTDQAVGIKEINQLDTKPKIIMKSVGTQSKKHFKSQPLQNGKIGVEKLSSYECEPFVCVPGECDPIECFKRIKMRQQLTKDFGTVTKYPKRKSIGSVATKMRDENLQAKHPIVIPNKDIQTTNYIEKRRLDKSYNQPRQSVRIGSNFSFNIEFFKNIENGLPNLEELNVQKPAQSASKKILHRHMKTQSSNFKQNVDSQVISATMQSTETALEHFRRCFCTLPLRNKKHSIHENRSMKIQFDQLKHNQSSVRNFLTKCVCTLKLNKIGKKKSRLPTTALKYEITGTSTHIRRAPQDLTKQPNRTLKPYECEPYVCVPGECDPYRCLKLIQRRKVRDFGTHYKSYVKDSATDSIKQPLTRSTKAQCRQNRKLNSRGTSWASKYTRPSRQEAHILSDPTHNTNRQVVRIGSNFSFNVEFFKDHGTTNIEHKDKLNAEKTSKGKSRSKKLRTKSISTVTRQRRKSSQHLTSKRHIMNSTANNASKRCFCTLKLLKAHTMIEDKHLSSGKTTKDKRTATKMKYTLPHELDVYECPPLMCIPGECNPYDCLDKMKSRGIVKKSLNANTQARKISTASVGNHTLNTRTYQNKSQVVNRRNTVATRSHSEPQSVILKSPENIERLNRRNKRAVRIGSNFKFNVEFFKQKSQPIVFPIHNKTIHKKEDLTPYLNKNVTAKARNYQHHNTQIDDIKLKDQSSGANSLKRCFCTLQLQRTPRHKLPPGYVHPPAINVNYPQTFTIGRVEVEPFHTNNMKTNTVRKAVKVRSTCTNPKMVNRTTGTKTDKKYLGNEEFPLAQCNPSSCPYYKKNIFGRSAISDMQTILPYTPSKFNKKESRTFMFGKNKFKKDDDLTQIQRENVYKPNDVLMFGKDKRRLTAKKSKKSIPTKSLETQSNLIDSFFCRCVKFFSRTSETKSGAIDKQENINIADNKQQKQFKSKRGQINFLITPKEAKTFGKSCPYICPENTNGTRRRYSKYQGRDDNSTVTKAHTKLKKFNNNQSKSETNDRKFVYPKMRVTFADNSKYMTHDVLGRTTNKSLYSMPSTRSRLCYSCSVNDCPLNFNNFKSDHRKLGNFFGKNKRISKKTVPYLESADDCQYCECCKRKIDTNEINKGGGDKRLSLSSQYKGYIDTCPCDKLSNDSNGRSYSIRKKSEADKLSQKYSVDINKCCSKMKPLFEKQLDIVSNGIINTGEVNKKMSQFSNKNKHNDDPKSRKIKIAQYSNKNKQTEDAQSTKEKTAQFDNSKQKNDEKPSNVKSEHSNLCICCKCVRKRKMQGAKISIAAKGTNNVIGTFGKLFPSIKFAPTRPRSKYRGPCICGSKKCAAQSKREKRDILQDRNVTKLGQPCICGSYICTTESRRLKKKRERKASKVRRKAQSSRDERERREVNKRIKIQEEKDEIRRLKRIKRNKLLEASVKKYKQSGDLRLLADSIVDIGKLGVSTMTSAVRYGTRSFVDPKVACERLCRRCRNKEPELIRQQLHNEFLESDTYSTLKRLKMRCLFMERVQSLKQKLESNPITHFILHIADKNPKTRQFKRQPVRHVREPLDFQCSLYMASLRKRPHLSVYYKYPWFYPHFLTILNIWKQFTDIMLFLLAAVVWSPCILCMEGCRALMCCFFCTG